MSKVYISQLADNRIIDYLKANGHEICLVGPSANVDPAISCHPDIYMCQLGDNSFQGSPALLTHDYPGHAIYNGCSTGKYFLHNLKITDPSLLEVAKNAGLTLVHVPQGYAKCSIVVVDKESIITADMGIAKAALKAGLEVLTIEKGQVILEGYPYGFIGGASGKVENTILFNGDLTKHSNFNEIRTFIADHGLSIKYFEDYPLTDIGSIIEEK